MKTTILILLAGIVLFRTGLCDESREPVLVGYLPEYIGSMAGPPGPGCH